MANTDKLLTIDEARALKQGRITELHKQYLNPGQTMLKCLITYNRRFVKADGVKVWDEDGNEYLDFLGGYGVLNLGHNNAAVWEALEKIKGSPVFLQAPVNTFDAVLAHNLAQVLPGKLQHSFFCNSGAEAVEGALKTARIITGRRGFVSCDKGFHGKTFGGLSVTGRLKYKELFSPLLPECESVPFGDLDSLEKVLQKREAAAFIVEPVQGEAGIIVPPDGYLRGARELCTRYGTLLIIDEIQTGFGRTGRLFACEHEGVAPDIICLAKALGGGVLPVGAFVTTGELWNRAYGGVEKCLLHTSTFGANTLAMVAGITALQECISQDLPTKARERGDYLLRRLKELAAGLPLIKEVRGRGLLVGVEFAPLSGGLLNRLTGGAVNRLGEEYMGGLVTGALLNEHRIITAFTFNNPNVIRLEPPLTITEAEIDRLIDALRQVLGDGKLRLLMKSGLGALGSAIKRQ